MHEECTYLCGLARRVQKHLVVPVPLIATEERLPAAPTAAAYEFRMSRLLRRNLRHEVRTVTNQRCVDAVHFDDSRFNLTRGVVPRLQSSNRILDETLQLCDIFLSCQTNVGRYLHAYRFYATR